ncbi:uncharacterized protein LOC124669238 [Lolium rigidum]|uniref:uncharacterized protein LOC124669238 n=1 Tax=Lolium rigidum TaxID=89674 RepID=UPI001F5D5A2C|nr:uncharacterized protein LOC124669238 [Lolium rigidum]
MKNGKKIFDHILSVQYAERMENLGLHSHSDDKQEYVQHLHLQISFPYQTTSDIEEDIISAIEKKIRQAKAWLLHQPRNKSTKSSSHANKDVGTPRKTKIHLKERLRSAKNRKQRRETDEAIILYSTTNQ